jgi:hypothetical protein
MRNVKVTYAIFLTTQWRDQGMSCVPGWGFGMTRAVIEQHRFDDSFATKRDRPPKAFLLVRWFSLLSLICIALVSGVSSILLSNFLTEQMLQRDAEVSMQFVQSIADVQNARQYFLRSDYALPDKNLEEFFSHIATAPDVLRANVYSRDGRIVWSSDRTLIGQKFGANADLEKALEGHLEIETGVADWHGGPKPEHVNFGDAPVQFVELYLPVRDAPSGNVIGVVEVYKAPKALFATIRAGVRLICNRRGHSFVSRAVLAYSARQSNYRQSAGTFG